MYRIFLGLALWLAVSMGRLPAALVNGHGYVAVTDWASANGLKAVAPRVSNQITVTNRAFRLGFEVNSQEVTINGLVLRLLYPVAGDRGALLISQLDCAKTLRPVLYPTRMPADKRIMTICLDPGHGGKDTGNRVGNYDEKTYTLALAEELHDQLVNAHDGYLCGSAITAGAGQPAGGGFVREPAFQRDGDRPERGGGAGDILHHAGGGEFLQCAGGAGVQGADDGEPF
jgi:hypothetical protein